MLGEAVAEVVRCAPRIRPPVAVLEIKVPPEPIFVHDNGTERYDGTAPRTAWTSARGVVFFCPSGCAPQATFRGTSSSDPDGDLASWSLDFGEDDTFAGGSWTANPPAELAHTYRDLVRPVTLTVTESAGQSDSDPLFLGWDTFD